MKTWLQHHIDGVMLALAAVTVCSVLIYDEVTEAAPVAAAAPRVQAAEEMPGDAELPAECISWGKAGMWMIYRCEDDATGEVIFHSQSGMFEVVGD